MVFYSSQFAIICLQALQLNFVFCILYFAFCILYFIFCYFYFAFCNVTICLQALQQSSHQPHLYPSSSFPMGQFHQKRLRKINPWVSFTKINGEKNAANLYLLSSAFPMGQFHQEKFRKINQPKKKQPTSIYRHQLFPWIVFHPHLVFLSWESQVLLCFALRRGTLKHI